MHMAVCIRLLCCLLLFSSGFKVITSYTDPADAVALRSLKKQWQNTPPSWQKSDDPCGVPWEGVKCNNSRVTILVLPSLGLVGQLGGDIGGLTELISLDLSFNPGLTGPLPAQIGALKNLGILILAGCGFTGSIPDTLGDLHELAYLALNSNNFTGEIPASLGYLKKLYWLDLARNQLVGSLPVSTSTKPGLDILKRAKHFHLNNNRLSGEIPAQLFSSDMALLHLLLNGNQFTGEIPFTIGSVRTLEVLRVDGNAFTGRVPSNLNNLTKMLELNLGHNKLSGDLPDLSGMNSLCFVNLSNNSFAKSEPPSWFSTLPSLTTLNMEFGSLNGRLPQEVFSISGIQQVLLRNNTLNGTLSMSSNISGQLQVVDLRNNRILAVTLNTGYKNELKLFGNPVCDGALKGTTYCQP